MDEYINVDYLLRAIGADKDCTVCDLHGSDCMAAMFSRADICDIVENAPHAKVCPYYFPNKHDRGDDSLCRKSLCEVSADVQPVVRCKECAHWARADGKFYGSCSIDALIRNEDFWCANGVKNDDGEDVEGWLNI